MTSSFAQLSSSIDHYELYISNQQTEDELDENALSSASDWEAILEPSVDVSNLLYGKSDIAQAKVKQMNISSLPLCFSKSEAIKVFIIIPPEFGKCNQWFNSENVATFNNQPYVVKLEDVITNSAADAVTFLDEKLSLPLIHFLLRSTLKIILDIQIFDDNTFHKLSLSDIKLILAYLDACLFSRNILHNYLCKVINVTDDIKDHVTSNFTNTKFISKASEDKWIDESTTILPPDQRNRPLFLENAISLEHFNDVHLKNAYDQEDGPSHRIETETARWLQDTDVLEREDADNPLSKLTDKSLTYVKDLIASNKQLIEQAIKTKNVLSILERHIKLTTTVRSQDELFRLGLNSYNKKLKVSLNPKPFLADNGVTFTIELPSHCGHSLGADGPFLSSSVTLGPYSYRSLERPPATSISNQIQHPNQSLAFPVRPVPRIILLVSDLCATLKRDQWLGGSFWSDYQILTSIVVDESTIDSQLINLSNTDESCHRLNNAKTLLSRFHVCLLDDRFHKILFQKKTYMSLQIDLSPYTSPY